MLGPAVLVWTLVPILVVGAVAWSLTGLRRGSYAARLRRSRARRLVAVLAAAALSSTIALVASTPASAANVAVAGISQDGSPTFDSVDGPGRDSSASNGVVRTGDTVVYDFQYAIDGAGATNPFVRSELPVGMSWRTTVPVECSRAGSAITSGPNGPNTILLCNLPSTTSAETARLMPTATVSASEPTNVNGAIRNVGFTLGQDGGAPTVSNTVPVRLSMDELSYFDLSKVSARQGGVGPTLNGPDGLGPSTLYNFAGKVSLNRPYPYAVSGDAIRGVKPLASPITLTEDFSGMPPGTVFQSCGNSSAAGGNGVPSSSSGGASGATNSGRITCDTTANTVTFTGADTTLGHFPTDFGPDAISFIVTVAIPDSVIAKGVDGMAGTADDNSYPFTNRFTGFDPTSIDGTSNYGGGVEPTGNNVVSGTAVVVASRLGPVEKNFGPASAGRVATTNSVVTANVGNTNRNIDPGSQNQCDVFDHSAYELAGRATIIVGQADPYVVEYGHPPAIPASVAALQSANCGDADAVWATDPTDPVLGGALTDRGFREGIDRVRVRWTGPVTANLGHYWSFPLKVLGRSAYNGDGVALLNRAVQTLGPNAANVTRAQDIMNWQLATLSEVKTAVPQSSGTGNRYPAGGSIRFNLAQSVSVPRGGDAALVPGIMVTDILPTTAPRLTVVPGSPTQPAGVNRVEYCNVCDGSDWSTAAPAISYGVRWSFDPVRAGTALPPLSFNALSSVETPGNTAYTNTATVSATPSTYVAPASSSVPVVIDAPSTVLATKTTNAPLTPVNGVVSSNLRLRNNTSSSLSHLDVLDVLPYNGDNRSRPSSFAGGFSALAATGVPAGLTAYVTATAPAALDAADGTTDGRADPGNPGGAGYVAPGTGIWSCTLAQVGTAGCPTAAQVTAVRFAGDAPDLVPARTTYSWNLDLTTVGNASGDVYTNRFVGRVDRSQLALPVQSPDATATVVAPAVTVAKDVCVAVTCSATDDAAWVEAGTVPNGGRGTFRVRVTNTGNVAATATVTDALPAGLTYVAGSATVSQGTATGFPPTWAVGTLQPGTTATLTFRVTPGTDLAATTNTASAVLTDQFNQTARGSDTASLASAAPSLTVVKSITGTVDNNTTTRVDAGDRIDYRFRVSNTGQFPLTPTINDPLITNAACPAGTVAPGGFVDCTGSYVATPADVEAGAVVNTARATGTPAQGTAVTSGPSTATQPLSRVPAVDIVKTATPSPARTGGVRAGDTISYSFRVTNTGNVSLSNVRVSDPALGTGAVVTCGQTGLAVGASTTCTTTATRTVTQAQVDDGTSLRNTATVNADAPGGATVTDSDTATTPVAASAPAVSMTKTATPGDTDGDGTLEAGETIRYGFTVTNTGDVAISAVRVDDPLLAGQTPAITVSCAPTTLAPGAVATCTSSAAYTITQADVDSGGVTNDATATGTPTRGTLTPATATTTTPLTSRPDLTLVKTGTVAPASRQDVAQAGDVITYTFAVTNTGTQTLTALAVTDPSLGAVTCTPRTLASGQAASCTAARTRTVTQAEVDSGGPVSNTATATANGPTGTTVTRQDTVDIPTVPRTGGVRIVKSAALGDADGNDLADIGEQIAYTFVVTNTGSTTLTGVSVDDPRLAAAGTLVTCMSTTLAPGAFTTCRAAGYVVTAADVYSADHRVANSATAVGTPPTGTPGGPVTSDPSTTSTPTITPVSSLSLVKRASRDGVSPSEPIVVGQAIRFSFTVTNTGNVPLTGIAITDDLLGATGTGVTCRTRTLAPGEEEVCTADGPYLVTQDDVEAEEVVNTATAGGVPPQGPGVTSNESTTTTPGESEPSLVIAKTAAVTPASRQNGVRAGDTIAYTFRVTNNGNVTVSGITVSDPALPAGATVTCLDRTLAPGRMTTCEASAARRVTQTEYDAGAPLPNTATASGTASAPGGGTTPVTDSDTAVVPVAAGAAPAMTLDKTATPVDTDGDGTLEVGEGIRYGFLVTNTGETTISGVRVADPLLSAQSPAITVVCTPTTVAPRGVATCTSSAAYTITQDDVDAGRVANTATADGTPARGVLVPPTDSTSTALAATPAVDLVKAATVSPASHQGAVQAGDRVTYGFAVENTGGLTLTGLTIADPMLPGGGSDVTCTPVTLRPGQEATCTAAPVTITQAQIDAGTPIVNTATVTGTTRGGTQATDTSTATLTPAAAAPGIAIDKTAALDDSVVANGTGDAGELVTYGFGVTNTGNTTLTDVTVADPTHGAVTCPPGRLAPQTSVTCSTVARRITQADVDAGTTLTNTATVTADDPRGVSVTDDDTAETPVSAAAVRLTIDKLADLDDRNGNDELDLGETVTYTFLLTNTGNVTLDDPTVTDPMLDAAGITVSCPAASLAPGGTTLCTASKPYDVTQDDVDDGVVVNTATGNATPPRGSLVPPTDTARVPADAVPAISLTKTASVTPAARQDAARAGDTITYGFTVTNTGTVRLTQVGVSDPMVGAVTCAATTLQPAEATSCTAAAKHTVTQAEVDNGGPVKNTATARGTAPDGVVLNEGDSVQTPVVAPAASMTLKKTGALRGDEVLDEGDEVTFTFLVTNTGNTTMTGMAVDDPMLTRAGDRIRCPATTLAPGQDATCTATYTATEADSKAGKITNVATAHAEGPGGTRTTTNQGKAVVTGKPGPTPGPGPGPDPDNGGGGLLPDTGGPALGIGLLGLALLAGGAVLLARRRRETRS